MHLTIRHTLNFTLGTPGRAVQHLLLTPLPSAQQRIEHWSIEMPGFDDAVSFRDAYGNKAHLVSLVRPDPEIIVTVTGTAETTDRAGILGRFDVDPMNALFRRVTPLTPPIPALTDGLDSSGGRIALLHELMERVHDLPAQVQSADGQSQSQSQTANPAATGVHAFIGAARSLDIPARHVTGYLVGDDNAASFHAWAEAWDEGLGWIAFDPALNACPTDHHVRLAAGLDAISTMPIRSVPVWTEMPAETVEIEIG